MKTCYVVSPRTGALCTIQEGECFYIGSCLSNAIGTTPEVNQIYADELNKKLGISREEADSMQAAVERAINGGFMYG